MPISLTHAGDSSGPWPSLVVAVPVITHRSAKGTGRRTAQPPGSLRARRALLAVPLAVGVGLLAACGSSGAGTAPVVSPSGAAAPPSGAAPVEANPPGDIPDNVAYVSYRNTVGRYSFVHPEGWTRTEQGADVTFTDKLNGVTATTGAAAGAPTVAQATARTVPALRSGQAAFQLVSVKPLTLPAGSGVLVTYRRNSAPDPVTGKVFRDEVQRYEVFGAGHEVVLELYGAVGSDNVDPYAKISQSLRLS